MPVNICQFCESLRTDNHTLRTVVLLTFIVQSGYNLVFDIQILLLGSNKSTKKMQQFHKFIT